jgi:hypothetical protein
VALLTLAVGAACLPAPPDMRAGVHGLSLLALPVLALAPVWLAGWMDGLARGPGLINALVAINPLTLLAAGAGTDYLRADWFYRHSPLGSLRYAYPPPASLLLGWLAVGLLPLLTGEALGRLALHRPRTRPQEASR